MVGLIRHPGIFVDGGQVIDCSRRDGRVNLTSLDRFSGGRQIHNAGHTGGLGREAVLANAYRALGQEWSLMGRNCETFVRECQGRSPISPQLVMGFAAILVSFANRR